MGQGLHRRQQRLEADVGGLDEQVDGEAARGEQLERGREAGRVVVVRADRGELEDDHAVLVHAGPRAARADEHEGPGVVEVVERGLGRRGAARALERHRVGMLGRAPHRHRAEVVGRDDRGRADRLRPYLACGGRLRDRDVGDADAAQHREDEQPDRSGAGDEDAVVRGDVGEMHRVERDGGRLGECRGAQRQPVRDPQQARRGGREVAAVRAAEAEQVALGAPQAHRGTAPPTGAALAAAPLVVGDDGCPDLPAVDAVTDGGDRAGPLVAEDGAGPRSAPGRGGGRCRRSRSARSRRGLGRGRCRAPAGSGPRARRPPRRRTRASSPAASTRSVGRRAGPRR